MKKELNKLVLSFKETKCDETFAKIYEVISESWTNLAAVASSLNSDLSETTALYEDTLMKCIGRYNGETDFTNFFRACVSRARTDLYRKRKWQLSYEEYETRSLYDDDSIAATIESIADDFDLETETTKMIDQRQLIDHLMSGADELTTAIVKALMNEPDLGPTAIGRKLGINHHSTVTRKLERLAAKFDSKQFGDIRDYLVA